MASPVGVLGFLLFCFIGTTIFLGFHNVSEGHVGVYYRGGALLNRLEFPGFHVKIPFLDSMTEVQVTLQTDKVTDIPCGTSGGVMIWIERIEVVNRLKPEYVLDTVRQYTANYDRVWIFDKIHHEINQFCSKHTLQEIYIDLFHTVDEQLMWALSNDTAKYVPGLEIIAVRITKPKIPATILKNYEQMESEKTRLLVATQTQKVVEKEAETEKKRETIAAEKDRELSAIRMDQQIRESEARKSMARIKDEEYLHHERALADADFYKVTKQAEANSVKLTPEFIKLEGMKAIAQNTKIYFGPSLNALFLGEALEGKMLEKLREP